MAPLPAKHVSVADSDKLDGIGRFRALLRMRLAIALVSMAVLALELALMRMLALRFWYHFAWMVISVGLLGFGASGTAMTIPRERIQRSPRAWFRALAFAFALAVPVCWGLSRWIPLDIAFLAWSGAREMPNVLLLEVLMLLPFFLAGAALGAALLDRPEVVTGHYAANLAGSGLGALATVLLMHVAGLFGIILFTTLLPLCGGLLLLRAKRRELAAGGVISCAVALVIAIVPRGPLLSEYKALSVYLKMRGTRTIQRREGPLGRIDVIEGPAIHYGSGLSLQYTRTLPPHMLMITDGDGVSPIYDVGRVSDWEFMDHTTQAAAYALTSRPTVLLLGTGGGSDIGLALYHESPRVTALEMNPQIIELMRGPLARRGGQVYMERNVSILNEEARGYLARSRDRFDVIELPPIDAAGASGAGLYASQESYLYTVESLAAMIDHLADNGVLCVTRWARMPPRDGLKLLDIARAACRSEERDPRSHLAMIRNWFTVTVLVSARPLDRGDCNRLRAFCRERGFDLCWLPDLQPEEVNLFHVLDRPLHYEAASALLGAEREDFVKNYLFDIAATTDDRPYYFHFFRWATLGELRERLRGQLPAFMELGYLMIIMALAQTVPLSFLLILVPLIPSVRSLRGTSAKWSTLEYFLLIGLGFMFLEMGFIQKLILYLAHPMYSAAAVIAGFLVFAGIGAHASGVWKVPAPRIAGRAAAVVVLLALGHLFFLDKWLNLSRGATLPVRVGIVLATIAPLAFAMGHMFPTIIGRLARTTPVLVPWAWAVNGCASVLATVLSPLLAIHAGFSCVILVAAGCYAVAGLIGRFGGIVLCASRTDTDPHGGSEPDQSAS
jgi:hypothetical protein